MNLGTTLNILSLFIIIYFVLIFVSIAREILLQKNAQDPNLLKDNNSQIGIPNNISFIRAALMIIIAITIIAIPHDRIVNTIVLYAVIIVLPTDLLDGFIARHFDQVTEAGKIIDGLCDKPAFYLPMIGYVIAHGTTSLTNFLPTPIVHVAIISIVGRDILLIALMFYLKKTKKQPHRQNIDMSAGLVDKIRSVLMCIWLVALLANVVYPPIWLPLVASYTMVVAALLSLTSIAIGITRFIVKPCER